MLLLLKRDLGEYKEQKKVFFQAKGRSNTLLKTSSLFFPEDDIVDVIAQVLSVILIHYETTEKCLICSKFKGDKVYIGDKNVMLPHKTENGNC